MAKLIINEEACKGCGLCVTACPKKILELSTKKPNSKGYFPVTITDEEACISCASCAKMCPDLVFSVYKELKGK